MKTESTLKEKAISGSIWSIVEKFSLQIVQFVVGIILARLLNPKDYGLIALTLIFTSISAAITDGGFEKTIIHKTTLTPVQLSTIFYLNCLLGILMSGVLIVSAPALASFFNEPAFARVLQVVSLGIFINALGQTQSTLLRKELIFKKMAYAQIASSLLGGIAGIVLAYKGFGVWALVYSMLISQVIMLVFYWYDAVWYPKLLFSFASIRSMLPYGFNILFSSILFFFIQQFNNFIIGKFYSKTELGLFSRGNRFPELVTSLIESVMLKMSFPLFAKLQDDNRQLSAALGKSVKVIAFFSFPLLTILFVNAHDITIFLFTEKWAGSIIFLQLFCLVRILHPFVSLYREVVLAKGRAKLLSVILTVTSSVEIVLILLLIKFGIMYIIMATLASIIIQYGIYITVVSREIDMQWKKHLSWLTPYLVCSMAAAGVMFGTGFLLAGLVNMLFLKIALRVGAGVIAYVFFIYFARVDEVSYIRHFCTLALNKLSFLQRFKLFTYKKVQ